MKISEIQAAGGVLLRGDAESREVLLVRRHRNGGDWTLPKGKVQLGETVEQAAIREILEETGYTVTLGSKIGEVHYMVKGRSKTVHFWHLQIVGTQAGVEDTGEVAEAVWLAADVALARLSYELERDVLKKALQ